MEEKARDILEWDGSAVGLLDLDAFFASVEQLDHPEWRGKPVIVGGSAEHRGVVSTASYEARRFGVHSAMPSAQARRLCPNAIWTRGNFPRYREVSAAVIDILSDETPLVEQVSIDEAFFDVTPGRFSRENPIEICRRVQARVAMLGVSCSIGLGVNKTVAKIASERDKPRGLTVVFPGTEASFLAPLPVSAMSGIGPATERHLVAMGIRTLGDLSQANPEKLRETFGMVGPRMVERAAGRERSRVAERAMPEEAKSVSNERTFDHDLTTGDEIRAAVLHIAAMTGRRLRRKGLAGSTVTLKLRFADLHVRTAQRQLPLPTNDEFTFGPVAVELLSSLWQEGTPVRLVGVGVSDFAEERGLQMALFNESSEASDSHRDQAALSKLTDALRDRFGDDAVSYGRDLRFRDHTTGTAPMGKNDV
ncbi:MAG: DNA polymerase IV [Olsenella sp.]|jgi:DNA polymerase-4|nr:DNA polymerase IV [Olsenella sp.]MCI1646339.1 DNA polymerase IV [Olsenella sp.]MCI1667728.1 DNA polymerase IV [Olsenella sp.]MCI1793235.1 DNA polymerase IV [Olsenella sp.]MCI1810277.1 DNA polymerase IV [Olsenella sp.]